MTIARFASRIAPLRWTRAASFGAVSAGIGTIGHASATGGRIAWGVLLAAGAMFTLTAAAIGHRRIGPATMVVAVAIGQALVHAAAMATHAATAATQAGGAGGAGGATAAAHHAMHYVDVAHASSPWLMLAVHLVATIVGVTLLLRLEHAAWARVKAVAVAVVAWVRGAAKTRRVVLHFTPSRALAAHEACSDALRLIESHLVRRGPPVAAHF